MNEHRNEFILKKKKKRPESKLALAPALNQHWSFFGLKGSYSVQMGEIRASDHLLQDSWFLVSSELDNSLLWFCVEGTIGRRPVGLSDRWGLLRVSVVGCKAKRFIVSFRSSFVFFFSPQWIKHFESTSLLSQTEVHFGCIFIMCASESRVSLNPGRTTTQRLVTEDSPARRGTHLCVGTWLGTDLTSPSCLCPVWQRPRS